MCLSIITKHADEMPEAMIGYKYVGVRYRYFNWASGKCKGYKPYYNVQQAYHYAGLGCGWGYNGLVEQAKDGTYYSAGVHAYTRRDVLAYGGLSGEQVRCLLRGPLCAGYENNHEVVVYREMTILEEV